MPMYIKSNKIISILVLLIFICLGLVSCRPEVEEEKVGTLGIHLGTEACIEDHTIYFISDSWARGGKFLLYADAISGIGGPLCGKAECAHKDETCNAYLSNTGVAYGLNIYRGKLYWISDKFTGKEGYAGRYLYSVNLDGTGRNEVRQLLEAKNQASMLSGNLMVIICNNYVVECGSRTKADSGIEKTVSEVNLYAIDKGKDVKLYQNVEAGYSRINPEVIGGDLYFLVTRQNASEEGQKWSQESEISLFRYSFKSEEYKCIFQDQVDFFPWEFQVNGNEVYFSCVNDELHDNTIYCLDLDNAKITEHYKFPGGGDGSTYITDQGVFRREFRNGNLQQEYCSIVGLQGDQVSSWNNHNTMLNENGMPLIYHFIGINDGKVYLKYSGYGDDEQLPEILAAFSIDIADGTPMNVIWQNDAAKKLLQNNEEQVKDEEQALKIELKLNPSSDEEIIIRDLRELDKYTVEIYYTNDSNQELRNLKRKAYINGVLCQKGMMDPFPAKTRNKVGAVMLYDIREQEISVPDGASVIRVEVEGETKNGDSVYAEAELSVSISLDLEQTEELEESKWRWLPYTELRCYCSGR